MIDRTIKEAGYPHQVYILKEVNGRYTSRVIMSPTLPRIEIVCKDPFTKKIFDSDTIFMVCLHEISHVISKTTEHGNDFQVVYNNLLLAAKRLNYLSEKSKINSSYPCHSD